MSSRGLYKTDCRLMNGFMPCKPHKESGMVCDNCTQYQAASPRILIIKTGAAGDVVRTTPILRRLKELHPHCEITWITEYPELLPTDGVDKILSFNWSNCLSIQEQKYDILINLDKSVTESALANKIQAQKKIGFLLSDRGVVIPADQNAFAKWETGINDSKMHLNKKHFVEETFEVCGFKFNEEEYWIHPGEHYNIPSISKKNSQLHIGLNTGCGVRWPTRLWPEEYFVQITEHLKASGVNVVLLGGPDEHEKNLRISAKTGAYYFGVRPLREFVSIIDQMDLILSSVTLAMHLSIARKKPLILMNNIFPTNEFYLYGRGEIVEPGLSCQSCYKNQFDSKCLSSNCMQLITPSMVMNAITRTIPNLALSNQA